MSSVAWPAEGGEEKRGNGVGGLYIIVLNSVSMCACVCMCLFVFTCI